MSESIQKTKKTEAEEQEKQDLDDLSRSPGVTDRDLIDVRKSSKTTRTEQSAKKNESEPSLTEDKD